VRWAACVVLGLVVAGLSVLLVVGVVAARRTPPASCAAWGMRGRVWTCLDWVERK